LDEGFNDPCSGAGNRYARGLGPSFSKLLFALFCTLVCAACGSKSKAQVEHHYALTGRVVALDAKAHTATVDAGAIPNFMDAMTMDYPIKSPADFNALRVGEKIKATVNVSDSGDYNLTDVRADGGTK
jgi:Cu/Ag efflux protein CusF